MGQSNVWYADRPEHQPFKERVLSYINSDGTHVPEGPKAWVFQANPRLYDIDAAVRALSEMTWTVSAYKDQIAVGDEVFVWRSGPEAGIIAIATVLAPPSLMGGEDLQFAHDQERFSGEQVRVRLHLDQVVSPALSRDALKADVRLSQLSILKFSQGTNFIVTPGEAKAIHELLEKDATGSVLSAADDPDAAEKDDIPATDELPVDQGAARLWVYAPGPNAKYWEEFYRDGIMAIGWDEIGDLAQYPDLQSTAHALITAYSLQRHPINDSNACFEFAHVMQPGDKVIANEVV